MMPLLLALLAAAALGVPQYPGARTARVGDALVQTTADAPAKAKARYAAIFARSGWRAAAPEEILNGEVPGMPQAAAQAAGTMLSFERDGRTADVWISGGNGRTMVMVMVGEEPKTRARSMTGDAPKGRSDRGRFAR